MKRGSCILVVIFLIMMGSFVASLEYLPDSEQIYERTITNKSPSFGLLSVGDHSTEGSSRADDTHGSSEGHGETTETLFGSLGKFEPKIVAAAMAIVVGTVLAMEYLFHGLHELTHDTPFNKMVSTIEKELMIVGCTAFLFKIFVNTTTFLEHNWLFALEYSDLLVPLFSFSNCLLGVMLIFVALKQCNVWSKAFHLKLEEVLDDFYSEQNKTFYRFSLKPLHSAVAEMEFRIFHSVFCDMFRIQKRAFAFDEYVELVFEKYVMKIIKIGLVNWFLFLVLLLLNIARSDGGMYFHECELEDYKCIDFSTGKLFTVGGAMLYVVTSIIALVSRRYEVLVIAKRGISCIDEYPAFLQHESDISRITEVTGSNGATEKFLNEEDLKNVVNEAKLRRKMKKQKPTIAKGVELLTTPTHFMHGIASWCGCVSRYSSVSPSQTIHAECSDDVSHPRVVVAPSTDLEANDKESDVTGFDGDGPIADSVAVGERPFSGEAEAGGVSHSYPLSNCNIDVETDSKYKSLHQIHRKADFVKEVFWRASPEIYFETVQLLIMFIALYVALWLVNFVGSTLSPAWKFITILPGLLSTINFFYTVKTAALLKAICHIDNDAVLEVIEQTEGSRLLGETIRDKLLKKLQLMGDAREELRNLFNEIDDNDSNLLSRKEFEVLMTKMEINFSRKKWKQIYHEIDRNYDDLISFEEFFLFMFPHHDEAKAMEKKRLKLIRDRVVISAATNKPQTKKLSQTASAKFSEFSVINQNAKHNE